MLYFILYLCLLIGGAVSGYLAARPFENRVMHLDDIIFTLRMLQAEMDYLGDPLPVILERVGQRTKEGGGKFLLRVLEILKGNDSFNFYKSWEKAVWDIYGESALKDEDRDILLKTGLELGKTDMESQQALFTHAFTGLERQRKAAYLVSKSKGRVYMALGTASGFLALIILI